MRQKLVAVMVMFFILFPFKAFSAQEVVWGECIYGEKDIKFDPALYAILISLKSPARDISLDQIIKESRKAVENGFLGRDTKKRVAAIFIKPFASFTDWGVSKSGGIIITTFSKNK